MTEFEILVLRKLDDMDTKIDDNHKITTNRLSQHMDDEEGKIENMGNKFVDLQRAVDSFSTGVNALVTEVQSAFLEHPDDRGRRDYAGHYSDHKTRKRWYDTWSGWVRNGFGNMVVIAMASGAAWLVYAVWQHILRGPQQ